MNSRPKTNLAEREHSTLRRILYVESSLSTRLPSTHLLTQNGYLVDIVQSGEDALSALMRDHYDIVMLHNENPQQFSEDFVRRLKTATQGVQVLIIEPEADPMSEIQALHNPRLPKSIPENLRETGKSISIKILAKTSSGELTLSARIETLANLPQPSHWGINE